MTSNTKIEQTGTGQQGAGVPDGAKREIPVHIEGEPVDNLEHSAEHAARKGLERQHREDPDIFTK